MPSRPQVPQFVADRWHTAGDKPTSSPSSAPLTLPSPLPLQVPQFVAERWHKAGDKPGGEAAAGGGAGQGAAPTPPPPGGGAGAGGVGVVGRVRMAFDPRARPQGGQAATQFMMRLEVPEGAAAELPMEYNLAFTPDHVPMHVFSESASGRIALEGKVEHKFDMQPPSGDRGYRQMLQTREKKWNTPKRKLQMYDPGAAGPRLPMPGTVSNVKRKASTTPTWQQAAAARAAEKESKRVRMSRDVVEAKLFALFEERPHWTLKHLTDATQQPQQFLKEVLGDMCVYNKRGPNQGLYELKPEYKHAAPPAT
ncbi:unnamed protein product [Closterium sp. NIES-65]|nr:unnamed protein product [Closterium sp. NIES-65]